MTLTIVIIGSAACAPEDVRSERDSNPAPASHDTPLLDKRSSRYDFGLGKRAYSYVSEYKRLPVYNFGLGKRSKLYSFGLGKRSVSEDLPEDEIPNEIEDASLPEVFEYDDDATGYQNKRARPYSFGLGKRFVEDDDNEEKRARMYNFGLGKRPHLYSFGLGKRARNYNFGLGKRLSKFNFGLGKRERDLHRFNFGLGKRSDTSEESDNYLEN
ncbi:unnamed protein product [Leptidea sinapis]|uniref:Allatostatin A n=1 Tax=Leptidea sinapis TaxID=189913 RepID=A0A5E4PY15_9NEOP|nr:unnamed protein product [Leptidea sinapis]